MSSLAVETALFWAAVVVYAIATLLAAGGLVFGSRRAGAYSWIASLVGFALHTGSLAARWAASGGSRTSSSTRTSSRDVVRDAGVRRAGFWRPALRVAGIGVLAFTILSLGYAATLPSASGPVTAPYKSVWLGVHVLFAWATYAAYAICAALGLRRDTEVAASARPSPGPGWSVRRTSSGLASSRSASSATGSS